MKIRDLVITAMYMYSGGWHFWNAMLLGVLLGCFCLCFVKSCLKRHMLGKIWDEKVSNLGSLGFMLPFHMF